MRIGVYGYTDKRPVIYALLKLLQATGDVVLLTNHRHYQRLLENEHKHGHIANILIIVSDLPPMEALEIHGYSEADFEHLILDLQGDITIPLDVCLYVKGLRMNDREQAVLAQLADPKIVKLTYDGRREKGTIHIAPHGALWTCIEEIESYRVLHPIPAKELNRGLAILLAEPLGMKQKAALKVLSRRWKG